jgi:hypothetical protein
VRTALPQGQSRCVQRARSFVRVFAELSRGRVTSTSSVRVIARELSNTELANRGCKVLIWNRRPTPPLRPSVANSRRSLCRPPRPSSRMRSSSPPRDGSSVARTSSWRACSRTSGRSKRAASTAFALVRASTLIASTMLRFSEDEAFRRVSAARLVRRFPMLLEAVAAGELHLTGLLMLGPLLTPDNVGEVLARAKHRTKKELARLVRSLAARGPAPHRTPRPRSFAARSRGASWSRWMSAMNPVRELESGARPRDWIDGAFSANRPELLDDGPESAEPAPARVTAVTTSAEPAGARGAGRHGHDPGRTRAGAAGASALQGPVRGKRRIRGARRAGEGSALA